VMDRFLQRFLKCLGMVLALILMGLGVNSRAAAQSTYTSQLTGVVSDSLGAVIPGARVTLTDEETNIPANNITNGSCRFRKF